MTRARIVFDPLNNDQKIIIICISCTHSAVQDPFLSPNDPLNNVIKRRSGPVNIIRIWERPFNKQKNLSRFIASVAKENEWILFLIAMSRSIVPPIALLFRSHPSKRGPKTCFACAIFEIWTSTSMHGQLGSHTLSKKKKRSEFETDSLAFALQGKVLQTTTTKGEKKQTAKLRILIKIDFNYRPRFDGK